MGVVQILLLSALLHALVGGSTLYIGTEGDYIYQVSFNDATGGVALVNSTRATTPSYFTFHLGNKHFYTTNEVETFQGQKNSGGITAYKLDDTGKGYSVINAVPSYGGSPAHISFDRTYKWLAVANYDAGNYGIWAINDDFSIAPKPNWLEQDTGRGPLPNQDGPHAHEFVFDPSNKIAVVPDLGTDTWNVFAFDQTNGILSPLAPVRAPPGSGPRHILFHPTIPFAYGISEMGNTVTVFGVSSSSLQIVQTVDTLEHKVPSSAAEVQFSPDLKFLYASNRLDTGNGTIAIFSVNPNAGTLTNIGYFGTDGQFPRFFVLSRDGNFVLVGNQNSNSLKVFARNRTTGLVSKLVSSVENLVQISYIYQYL